MKNKSVLITVWVALATLWSVGALGAEEFAKGPGALEIFDGEGFAATPLWGQLWLVFLVSTFAALGLPMLSGSIAIWHLVCWTPALVLLLTPRPFFNPNEGRWYRIWSGVMTCAILISFVFDIRAAAIYIDHFSGLGG